MSYPTLEQYNQALQHPNTAFSDPELKNGTVLTTGLGLPLALCGGFALTYSIENGGRRYAVRCFHKKSDHTELRYEKISLKIDSLQSTYFVDFEFQSSGINVAGRKAPIVKMAWASGDTMGVFLEANYRHKNRLQSLNSSLRSLAKFLEAQGIAHGDIQPDNIMVANNGQNIQLIDYDGMYLDEIKSLGTVSDGLRNFQHPKRDKRAWDARLDRFSFIELNLALRILESYPNLWNETKSEATTILFKANDFASPGSSKLFNILFGMTDFSDEAKNFAAICQAPFNQIPTLEDFLARKNIPQISITSKSSAVVTRYIGSFPVLDATDYNLCFRHVGDRVELVGRILAVKRGWARNKRPYVFLNFIPWRSKAKIVAISIWSQGLSLMPEEPDSSWVGKWITVSGLMDPPYHNSQHGTYQLSIGVTQANQIHTLTESEALYRLDSPAAIPQPDTTASPAPVKSESNKKIMENLQKGPKPIAAPPTPPSPPPLNSNQSILQEIERQKKAQQKSPQPAPQKTAQRPKAVQQPKTTPKQESGCFIATAVYGYSAPETNTLRKWRDHNLLTHLPGRMLTRLYYLVSPSLSQLIGQHETLKKITRRVLDHFISWISP